MIIRIIRMIQWDQSLIQLGQLSQTIQSIFLIFIDPTVLFFTPLIQYLRISTPILAGPLLASNFMGYNTRQSLYKWVVEYPEQ